MKNYRFFKKILKGRKREKERKRERKKRKREKETKREKERKRKKERERVAPSRPGASRTFLMVFSTPQDIIACIG